MIYCSISMWCCTHQLRAREREIERESLSHLHFYIGSLRKSLLCARFWWMPAGRLSERHVGRMREMSKYMKRGSQDRHWQWQYIPKVARVTLCSGLLIVAYVYHMTHDSNNWGTRLDGKSSNLIYLRPDHGPQRKREAQQRIHIPNTDSTLSHWHLGNSCAWKMLHLWIR